MLLHRKIQIVGIVIILGGLAAMAPLAYFWQQNKIASASPAPTAMTIPAVAPVPEPKPTLITGKPVRLEIPSLGIDLAVVEGAYDDKKHTWSLTDDKAHYALPSTQPNNEEGNTLIYGHYRKEVFARLRNIQPGARASITTDSGHRFTYDYRSNETFHPANTSVFAYEGDPRLTIQTCSGVWMQNRQMFYFDLTNVEKL